MRHGPKSPSKDAIDKQPEQDKSTEIWGFVTAGCCKQLCLIQQPQALGHRIASLNFLVCKKTKWE